MCAFEWSRYFGWNAPEPDVICHNSLDWFPDTLEPLAATTPSVTSVQGRLKQHEDFWLHELEPSSFVAGISSEGYRLPIFEIA